MLKITADVILDKTIIVEYRLQHRTTGKFLGTGGFGVHPMFCDDWHDAPYFGSDISDLIPGAMEEGKLEFQWKWMRNECGEEWMHSAKMRDYRVHVVIGSSENIS